jgi:hypothetical protein
MPREGEVKVKISGTRPHDAANGNGSTNGREAPTAYRPTAVGAKLRAPAVYRPGGVPVQGKMGAPAVYRPVVPVQARFGGSMTAGAAVKAQGRRTAPEAYRPAMGLPVQGKIGAPGAYWPEVRGTGPGSSQVIQRIGQKPFGYTLPAPENIAVKDREELQSLGAELQKVIKAIRARAKEQKRIMQEKLLDDLSDQRNKNRKSEVIRQFARALDVRARFGRKIVRDDNGFKSVLKKYKLEYVEDRAKQEDKVERTSDRAVVLTIQRGDLAFVEAEEQSTTARQIYHKRGKATGANNEYVQDDMGVFTRRYAYLEKNKHQYRDLLNRSVLEGRWPADQTVKDRERPYNEINRGLRNKVSGLPTGGTFTHGYQLAYVHQELGSGPQQRGVSATTTPHHVFSNQGEAFRTDDGVRIQVDLANVPKGTTTEPEFVNHYAYQARKNARGVIDGYAIMGDQSRKFDHYKWSVKKNREVFLKTVRFGSIKSVTLHQPGGGGDTTYEGETLSKDMMAAGVNLAEYNAGFGAPDGTKTFTDPRATSTYKEGQRARWEYNAGREAARNFWATVKSEWATEKNLRIEGRNKLIRSENSKIEKENSALRNKHKRRPLQKLWVKVTVKDYMKSPQDSMNFQNNKFSGRDTNSTVLKILHDLSMEPEETRYVQGAWDGFYERVGRL